MKKVLSLLAMVAFTTLSASAAETAVGSFFDKVNKKEQEVVAKIEANQKAREAKKVELEKQQAAQKAQLEKAKKDSEARQAAQKAQLEKAKKDAEARQAARKNAIEAEKNYWKGLVK